MLAIVRRGASTLISVSHVKFLGRAVRFGSIDPFAVTVSCRRLPAARSSGARPRLEVRRRVSRPHVREIVEEDGLLAGDEGGFQRCELGLWRMSGCGGLRLRGGGGGAGAAAGAVGCAAGQERRRRAIAGVRFDDQTAARAETDIGPIGCNLYEHNRSCCSDGCADRRALASARQAADQGSGAGSRAHSRNVAGAAAYHAPFFVHVGLALGIDGRLKLRVNRNRGAVVP